MSPPQSTTKRPVAAQALGDQVGGQALAGAAGVEAQPRRAADLARLIVDLELAPAPARVGPGRPPGRGLSQRSGERRTGHAGARGAYPAASISPTRVGSTRPSVRSAACRPARTARRSSAEAGTASRGSSFSAQSSLSGLKRESAASNSRIVRRARSAAAAAGSRPGPGLADQEPHVAAHRVEADVVLAGHQEAPVVIGAVLPDSELSAGEAETLVAPGLGT